MSPIQRCDFLRLGGALAAAPVVGAISTAPAHAAGFEDQPKTGHQPLLPARRHPLATEHHRQPLASHRSRLRPGPAGIRSVRGRSVLQPRLSTRTDQISWWLRGAPASGGWAGTPRASAVEPRYRVEGTKRDRPTDLSRTVPASNPPWNNLTKY